MSYAMDLHQFLRAPSACRRAAVRLLSSAALLCTACSIGSTGPAATPPEAALSPCSAALPAGKIFPATGAGLTMTSASVCAESGTAVLAATQSLLVTGQQTIGQAGLLRLDQPVPPHGIDITLPADLSQLPPDDSGNTSAYRNRLTVLAQFGTAPAHIALITNQTVSGFGGGQVRFHLPGHGIAPRSAAGTLGDVAVFQVAMPVGLSQKAQKVTRHFTYRAIGGVSMGGLGSSMNFFRHPDRFDAVGVMGADPGPDLTYTLGFIRDYFFAGFCTAADQAAGRGAIGTACPPTRQPLAGQGEVSGTFENMPVQIGQGIGLTLNRGLYIQANRDLVRALSNWAYQNVDDPYLPPQVPSSNPLQTPGQACTTPFVIPGTKHGGVTPLYDASYNPQGLYDVITFCDGGARACNPQTDDCAAGNPEGGIYDPTMPQTDPVQILMAVDINGNGKRDPGEPVILQTTEPYSDVGNDGLADAQEPGYDPVKNPDPTGDDYHYLMNPLGSERNWRHDDGEPYQDVGIDGIKASGQIPPDFGEGNGSFDINQGLSSWLGHDPHSLIQQMDLPSLAKLDIYYDAGIHDFFNAQVSTNTLMGLLNQRGLGVQAFDGFPALQGLSPDDESGFNVTTVDLSRLGRRAYVRYGDPDLSDALVIATGDGRHVGTAAQAVDRAVMLFKFLLSRWPDPDTSLQSAEDPRLTPGALTFQQSNGRQTPYGLILPPGYFDPQNASVTYPVVYFGHGYGMDPESLGTTTGTIILTFMTAPDPAQRLPKAILVFIDAKCRPGGSVQSGPLPATGDLCEEGAFYSDHPQGAYLGETMIEELDAYLAKTYRVKAPADVQVVL